MSGWSALSTTILAARRVLPPDLITPAEASAAFMKDTGPEAVPPAESFSRHERSAERFTPEPEPPLKIMPSLRYQFEDRVHVVVDREDEAGRALRLGLDTDVEPDRAVEGRHLVDEQVGQFGLEGVALGVAGEVARWRSPQVGWYDHAADKLAHAGLALGLPSGPRKYFETTTLVAVCDQASGNSTSRCSKTTRPSSPEITAARKSQSTSAIGSTPGRVK